MKTITNQEFAEKTGNKYQKVRRWSRDLFGIDPVAGQSSGVAREYTPEEAFLLYLSGHLISERKVSIPDTKTIVEKIEPWFEKRNYFPLDNWRENHLNTVSVDGEFMSLSPWILRFNFHVLKDEESKREIQREICITAIGEAHTLKLSELEPVGEFEGRGIKKHYLTDCEIVAGCEGAIVNTVEVNVNALIMEFEGIVLF